MHRVLLPAIAIAAFAAGYLLSQIMGQQSAAPEVGRTYRVPPTDSPAPELPVNQEQEAATPKTSPSLTLLQQQDTVFDTLHLAFQMAADADMPTLRALASEAARQPDPLYRLHIADIFLERMTAIDPRQALDFAESAATYELQAQFTVSVLSSWARGDSTAAFAYYQGITSQDIKRRAAAALMRDTSLPESFRLAVQQAVGHYGEQLALSIAQQELSAEEAFLDALAQPGNRSMRGLYHSGMRWYRQDPDAALAHVTAMSASQQRSFLLGQMLGELAASDPEQALDLLALHAADDDNVQQSVLQSYAQADPLGARRYIESYTERTGDTGAMAGLLQAWVKQDPRAATEYAATLPKHLQGRVLPGMAAAYADAAPREALQWLLRLDSRSSQLALRAMSHRANGAVVADVAESMLYQVSDIDDRELLIESVLRYKSQQDPRAALQWLDQYPEHSRYGRLYTEALQRLAGSDPGAAAALLEQRWHDRDMVGSFGSTASLWGRKRPEEAIAWASRLPASAGRTAALSALVHVVAASDPERARSLYYALPEGKDRELAAVNLASRLSQGDPEQMRGIMVELGLSAQSIHNYMLLRAR